jgi:hypothetical protein
MFGYAKEHEPCIIFMDEIDAIGGRRFSEGTSADREIQRTLMELLNQLDGFDYLGKTKIIMATNRPDTLDPALLRAGRLDRKIEIPLPNEAGRLEVLKIHAASVQKEGEIDFESVVKMSDGLNGADLRNVVTEAGLFAIKDYRDAVNQDDFNKAVRKVAESKKLEGKLGKWIRCLSLGFTDPLLTKVILQNTRSSKWYESRRGMMVDIRRTAAIDVRKYKCTIPASVSLIMKKRSAKPLHLQRSVLGLCKTNSSCRLNSESASNVASLVTKHCCPSIVLIVDMVLLHRILPAIVMKPLPPKVGNPIPPRKSVYNPKEDHLDSQSQSKTQPKLTQSSRNNPKTLPPSSARDETPKPRHHLRARHLITSISGESSRKRHPARNVEVGHFAHRRTLNG